MLQVVNVYRLITRNTIEEKIMSLQKFKLKTANAVISSDNASLQSMATNSIMDLFSLDESPTNSECQERNLNLPCKKLQHISPSRVEGGWEGYLEGIFGLEKCEEQYAKEYDIKAFMSRQTEEAKAEELQESTLQDLT